MANSLEKFFLTKVKLMPLVEMDLTQQATTPKKGHPPQKVLPPGSSQQALANAVSKNGDSKPSPAKPAQHASLPPTVSQPTGQF